MIITLSALRLMKDRQPELTEERVDAWVAQIKEEMSLDEILG